MTLVFDNRYQLMVYKNGGKVYQYDLLNYVQTLYEKYGSRVDGGAKPGTGTNTSPERVIWTDETSAVKIMIVFNSINGSVNLDKNELTIDNIDGEIFLTVK